MKSILIIGLGRFGTHLCNDLSRLDNEIMIVDQDEAKLEDLLPLVVSAKIGDCTNEKVLKSLGVGNFDICFVCIGNNFQSSLEITSQLKEWEQNMWSARQTATSMPSSCFAMELTKSSTRIVILRKKLPCVFQPIRYSTMWNWASSL